MIERVQKETFAGMTEAMSVIDEYAEIIPEEYMHIYNDMRDLVKDFELLLQEAEKQARGGN